MSGLVFEKLTQTLQAGEVWRLTIAADFFRIAAASWPVKVRILKAGRILGEMDGWQAGDFVRDVEFDAVEVEAGAIAQTVTVQIAGGGVGSDRVLGEVSVIDGAAARVYAGASFSSYGFHVPTTGQYSLVQLWNPAGSGKDLIVSGFAISLRGADSWASLAAGTSAIVGTARNIRSKLIGGAGSVAQKISATSATSPGMSGVDVFFEIYQKADQGNYLKMNEPLIIRPGYGVTAFSGVNVTVSASFDFYEK